MRAIAVGSTLVFMLGCVPAIASTDVTSVLTASHRVFEMEIERLLRLGNDHADQALAGLDSLQASASAPYAVHQILIAKGRLLANEGRDVAVDKVVQELRASRDAADEGNAALIVATLADQRGDMALAGSSAAKALAIADKYCTVDAEHPQEQCNYINRWAALRIAARAAAAQGNEVQARLFWTRAISLAQVHYSRYDEAVSTSQRAIDLYESGELDLARRDLARAGSLARELGSSEAQARVKLAQSVLDDPRAPPTAQLIREGVALARRADAPRLEAQFLANLSDDDIKHGRLHAALVHVGQALPQAVEHHDLQLRRVLLHNRVLALIRLHRAADASSDINDLLVSWGHAAGDGELAGALGELSEAFAAVGDDRKAVELYHRERDVANSILEANRKSALEEVQTRHDGEAQQRGIDLLKRDNAVVTAHIHNGMLRQRLWTTAAILLALAVALAGWLFASLRRAMQQLRLDEKTLRRNSDLDPLTGLCNRRYIDASLKERCRLAGAHGTLFLLDLDHFKQVNDRAGHAVGDAVLVEVARRLTQVMREEDVVGRWGGEEFVAFAVFADPIHAAACADKLLRRISQEPVRASDAYLNITASIGYASLPSDGIGAYDDLFEAADQALYRAKQGGRNQAVGHPSNHNEEVAARNVSMTSLHPTS